MDIPLFIFRPTQSWEYTLFRFKCWIKVLEVVVLAFFISSTLFLFNEYFNKGVRTAISLKSFTETWAATNSVKQQWGNLANNDTCNNWWYALCKKNDCPSNLAYLKEKSSERKSNDKVTWRAQWRKTLSPEKGLLLKNHQKAMSLTTVVLWLLHNRE